MSNVDIHSEIIKNADQLEKVVEILKSRPEMAKVKDDRYGHGGLPLHTAMEYGRKGVFDLVQVLMKLHPEGVKTVNTNGYLPIHGEAGGESHRKAHEFLLKEYPEGSKIQNNDGYLPIHYAASNGLLSTVQLLLQEFPEGSKIQNNHGELPIHCAAEICPLSTVQLLQVFPEGSKVADRYGWLPIHRACLYIADADDG
jgi:ankyrin repeat protein